MVRCCYATIPGVGLFDAVLRARQRHPRARAAFPSQCLALHRRPRGRQGRGEARARPRLLDGQ
eukprot:10798280-Alexandrium_andersonii.AAC.1